MKPVSLAIAQLEWTLWLRSGVITTLLVSFSVLVGLAALSGADRAGRDAEDRERLAARRSAPASAARLAFEYGTFVAMPAAPLSGFAVGQADVYATSYHVTARLADAQLPSEQLGHPLLLHAGALDLLFVLLYFFPLLIIATSFDLFATERERGTIQLQMLQGAPMSAIVRGRLVSRLILVVVLPVAAAFLTAAVIEPGMLVTPRFALWNAVAIVYGLFWLGLAFFVNARGYSAMTNALALVTVWLMLVLVVPSALNLATGVVYPVPSRVELAAAMRQASRESMARGSQMLGRYLEDHPSSGTGVDGMRQFYALQEERDAEVARRLQPLLAAHERQLRRQRQFVSLGQYLSPTILGQMVLTDLAGTSGHRARTFAEQTLHYQRQWQAMFPPDVLAADLPAPKGLPEFQFVEESSTEINRRNGPPLAVLGAVALVLIWTGARRCWRLSMVATP